MMQYENVSKSIQNQFKLSFEVIAVVNATLAVTKEKPEKLRLDNGIRTHDLCDTWVQCDYFDFFNQSCSLFFFTNHVPAMWR